MSLFLLKMAGSGYRRFARSRLYEYNLHMYSTDYETLFSQLSVYVHTSHATPTID